MRLICFFFGRGAIRYIKFGLRGKMHKSVSMHSEKNELLANNSMSLCGQEFALDLLTSDVFLTIWPMSKASTDFQICVSASDLTELLHSDPGIIGDQRTLANECDSGGDENTLEERMRIAACCARLEIIRQISTQALSSTTTELSMHEADGAATTSLGLQPRNVEDTDESDYLSAASSHSQPINRDSCTLSSSTSHEHVYKKDQRSLNCAKSAHKESSKTTSTNPKSRVPKKTKGHGHSPAYAHSSSPSASQVPLTSLAQLEQMGITLSSQESHYFDDLQAESFLNNHLFAWSITLATRPNGARKHAKALLHAIWHAFMTSKGVESNNRAIPSWKTNTLSFIATKLISLITTRVSNSSEERQLASKGAGFAIKALIHTLENDFTAPRYDELVSAVTTPIITWFLKHHVNDQCLDQDDLTALGHLIGPRVSIHAGDTNYGWNVRGLRALQNMQACMTAGIWIDLWIQPLQHTLFHALDHGVWLSPSKESWILTVPAPQLSHIFVEYLANDRDGNCDNRGKAAVVSTIGAILEYDYQSELASLVEQILTSGTISSILPLLDWQEPLPPRHLTQILLKALESQLLAGAVDIADIAAALTSILSEQLNDADLWTNPCPIDKTSALQLLGMMLEAQRVVDQPRDRLLYETLPELARQHLSSAAASPAAYTWDLLDMILDHTDEPRMTLQHLAEHWAQYEIDSTHLNDVVLFITKYDKSPDAALKAVSGSLQYLTELYEALEGDNRPQALISLEIDNHSLLTAVEAELWSTLNQGLTKAPLATIETLAKGLNTMQSRARSSLVVSLGSNPTLVHLRQILANTAPLSSASLDTIELLVAVSAEELAMSSQVSSFKPIIGSLLWDAINSADPLVLTRLAQSEKYKRLIALYLCEELRKHSLTHAQLDNGTVILRHLNAPADYFSLITQGSPNILLERLAQALDDGNDTQLLYSDLELCLTSLASTKDAHLQFAETWKSIIAIVAHPESRVTTVQTILQWLLTAKGAGGLFGDQIWRAVCDTDPVASMGLAHAMYVIGEETKSLTVAPALLKVALRALLAKSKGDWNHAVSIILAPKDLECSAYAFRTLPKVDTQTFLKNIFNAIETHLLDSSESQLLYSRCCLIAPVADILQQDSSRAFVLEILKTELLKKRSEHLKNIAAALLNDAEWFVNFSEHETTPFLEQLQEKLSVAIYSHNQINIKNLSGRAIWSWAITSALIESSTEVHLNKAALSSHLVPWDIEIYISEARFLANSDLLKIIENAADIRDGLRELPSHHRLWNQLAKRYLLSGTDPAKIFVAIQGDPENIALPEPLQQTIGILQLEKHAIQGLLNKFQRFTYACCMNEPNSHLLDLQCSLAAACAALCEHHTAAPESVVAEQLICTALRVHQHSMQNCMHIAKIREVYKYTRFIFELTRGMHISGHATAGLSCQLQLFQTRIIEQLCTEMDKLMEGSQDWHSWSIAAGWLLEAECPMLHYQANQQISIALYEATSSLCNKVTDYIAFVTKHDISTTIPATIHAHLVSAQGYEDGTHPMLALLANIILRASTVYMDLMPQCLNILCCSDTLSIENTNIIAQLANKILAIFICAPYPLGSTSQLLPPRAYMQYLSTEEWSEKCRADSSQALWHVDVVDFPMVRPDTTCAPLAWLIPSNRTFCAMTFASKLLEQHASFEIWERMTYLLLEAAEGIMRAHDIFSYMPDAQANEANAEQIAVTTSQVITGLYEVFRDHSDEYREDQVILCADLLGRAESAAVDILTVVTPSLLYEGKMSQLETVLNNTLDVAVAFNPKGGNIFKLEALLDLFCYFQERQRGDTPNVEPPLLACKNWLDEVNVSQPIQTRSFVESLLKGLSVQCDIQPSKTVSDILTFTVDAWVEIGINLRTEHIEHPLTQPLGSDLLTRILISILAIRSIFKHQECSTMSTADLIDEQRETLVGLIDWVLCDMMALKKFKQLEHMLSYMKQDELKYLLHAIRDRLQGSLQFAPWSGAKKMDLVHANHIFRDMLQLKRIKM